VQTLESAVQLVPEVCFVSAGHVVPLQTSCLSHSPAAVRQTVPAVAAGNVQTLLEHATGPVQGFVSVSPQPTVMVKLAKFALSPAS
jgi:hypothetical protein